SAVAFTTVGCVKHIGKIKREGVEFIIGQRRAGKRRAKSNLAGKSIDRGQFAARMIATEIQNVGGICRDARTGSAKIGFGHFGCEPRRLVDCVKIVRSLTPAVERGIGSKRDVRERSS